MCTPALHPAVLSKLPFPCPFVLLQKSIPSTKNAGFLLAGVAFGIGISYVCCRKKSCSSAKAADAPVEADIVGKSTAVRSTAASGAVKGGGAAVYESSRAVQEYLCFHFLRDLIPFDCAPKNALDFPKRCADLCKKHSGKQTRMALDLGCAVGASAFELSKHYNEVVGLDFSHAFIDAAKMMQKEKKTTISIQQEGEIFADKVVTLPSGVNPQRITFTQGDACNLPEKHFGPFDAILGGNLLCRLPDPDALLNRLPGLVNPNGVVVFVSPYSWLEEYTPKDKWFGGYVTAGKPVDSATTLKSKMKALGFNLVEEQQMPFLIREHVRKYQWGCSHATVWRRCA
mmetsp:Transcript_15957/g.34611  ORF Transcript_15957/g.34611 Transcript_15957/m.34611 type:complete len:342 (-) Transcript_15957:239-1264(-)|eukprot:CAMPEP_0118922892 /NCGR_PEP_ID=MMETSP1169-20130426/1645_1 /TAXON_ID=36882 /ORGANISM="Pyramimonas obovata, Strain CCMP722" /LENGTH=341 /DNA_ID=CAMNT_0006863821 /DNA_START=90 /DNA_END=1115 /DNA_ORIENTATION=+